jgi:UDP-N-acetylmuramoyl-L-alanyl-D-glutamate--2,6-diaminopimelate ligase
MPTSHFPYGRSLRQLLPHGLWVGGQDVRFTSCCSEPQRCRPGDLYAALELPGCDGHDHANEAVRHGAVGVIAEHPVPVSVPVCLVPDSREAYGHICQELAGQPSLRLRTVGVTGTHGKTTTSLLIAAVLRATGQRTGVTSSIGYHDGEATALASRTTPPAAELAHWMARMVENRCAHAVLEISSTALAQRQVAGIQLDAAVLTNIRRDHLDYHGSLVNYRRAKARLFEHMKPSSAAIINADDPASRLVLRNLHRPAITVGIRAEADVTAEVVECYAGEQTLLLTAGCATAAVQTRMFGDQHAYNCLSAAAVGLLAGLDLTTVARGLESVEQVPGRLEPVVAGQPFGVYVDCARAPDSLALGLKALRRVTTGRLICVFGADARRDPALRPLLGRVVERYANVGIITNDNPREEEPLHIVHDILDGYDRPARAHVLPDRAEAIRWALSTARPGDAVLLAGKGDRTEQIIGAEHHPFDDREVARRWLFDVGAKIEYEEPARHILPFRGGVQLAN